ncbi:MAG: hypothetical protein ACLVEX_02455 [Ruthenibacterium lactatiformans]
MISHDTAQRAGGPRGRAGRGRGTVERGGKCRPAWQRILALKEKWVDGMPEGALDLMRRRREKSRRCCKRPSQRVHSPAGGRPALGSAPLCIGTARPTARHAGGECGRRRDEPLRRRHGTGAAWRSAAAMQPEP